jgi:hypothetical protein
MKSFFLSGIFILFPLISLFAQEEINASIQEDGINAGLSNQQTNYFLSLGLNILDNSKLPFNPNGWSIKTPFFVSLERSNTSSNFSTALSLSTNRLKVNSGEKSYFSVNAAVHYYFDHLIFKTKNIETFVGLGLGRFFLENNGNNSFNVIGGGRYWFSKNFGVSLQAVGKLGLKPQNESVVNHYSGNIGIVWGNSVRN